MKKKIIVRMCIFVFAILLMFGSNTMYAKKKINSVVKQEKAVNETNNAKTTTKTSEKVKKVKKVRFNYFNYFYYQKKLFLSKAKLVIKNKVPKKNTLFIGESFRINAAIKKSKKDIYSKLEWIVSNKKIVSVSKNGVVKARKKGKAKVTVRISGTKKQKTYKVVVKKFILAKKLKLKAKDKYVFVGDTMKTSLDINPNRIDEDIKYYSQNEKIATVNKDGVVSGHAVGKVRIYAKAKKSKKKSYKTFTVRENKLTQITVKDCIKRKHWNINKDEPNSGFFENDTEKSLVVGLGCDRMVNVDKKPSYVTDDRLIFTSDNNDVATVTSNGKIHGVNVGKAKIAVKWEKNAEICDEFFVYVSRKNGRISSEMLNKLDLSKVTNLMIVAHPDDETIFGGAHLLSDKWLVVCMTNGDNNIRSVEFKNVMDYSEDEFIHLDYCDDKTSMDYGWEYDELSIQADIKSLMSYKKWDTIVTHNPKGEYGHTHHKYLNCWGTQIFKSNPNFAKRFMYFGKYYQPEELTDSLKNTLTSLGKKMYNIKEEMGAVYESKKGTILEGGWLYHILPYENWIYYDDWKE